MKTAEQKRFSKNVFHRICFLGDSFFQFSWRNVDVFFKLLTRRMGSMILAKSIKLIKQWKTTIILLDSRKHLVAFKMVDLNRISAFVESGTDHIPFDL